MRFSISTVPLATYMHRKYYDLGAMIYVMKILMRERVVDGFELELLAEWNPSFAPVEKDTKYDRKFEWEASRKYANRQLIDILNRAGVPILAVHANRDIGVLLCSQQQDLVERGTELMASALEVAEGIGAGTCVFQLWDPLSATVDHAALHERLRRMAGGAAVRTAVRAAVENIPTYTPGPTPFEAVQAYEWITLDMKWAHHYNELERFRALLPRIVDVHLHGSLVDRVWTLNGTRTDFAALLHMLTAEWGYDGQVTLEPETDFAGLLWSQIVTGIGALRRAG
jgi:sugar phosphate isomerase/epimerase